MKITVRSLRITIFLVLCSLITSCSKPPCQPEGLFFSPDIISRYRKNEGIHDGYFANPHRLPPQLIKDTITQLNFKNSKQQVLSEQEFKKKLEIKSIETANIVEISYANSDPKLSARIINTFMVNTLEFYIKRQIILDYEWLNQAEQEKIKHLESKIVEYKQEVLSYCDDIYCRSEGLELRDFPNLSLYRRTINGLETIYKILINAPEESVIDIEEVRAKINKADAEYRKYREEKGYENTALDVLDSMSDLELWYNSELNFTPKIINYATASCSE